MNRSPSSSRRWLILGALAAGLLARAHAQELKTPPLQLPVPAVRLAVGRTFVRGFRFHGNKVFTSAQLAKVTAPFTGRELGVEEIEDARRAVTLHYLQHGYVNSGAVLPDQKVEGGIVTLEIVEGKLTEVVVTGNKWLRNDYIRSRVQHWAGSPLDVLDLKDGLQLLRRNPNVTQVNAELQPGALPGESRLQVRVTDQQPFQAGLQFDNSRPPDVGSMEILALLADRNLTGHGDPLAVAYGIADGGFPGWEFSGIDNVEGAYALPLTPSDTTLSVYGNRKNYAIISEQLSSLNIASSSYLYGASLRQPLYQTAAREFAVAVAFDRRHSETTLLGKPFDVSPGSVNGQMNVSVLRLSQEWVDRGFDRVFAARSTVSIGLDALGTTDNGTSRDAQFVAWLGQAQYIQRLFHSPTLLVLRSDVQWTGDKLLSLEQFSLGGINSVRGYLENQLVRDRGFFGSVEVRVPILFDKRRNALVQLAPFFDSGGAWDVGGTPKPTTIVSAGIGLLLTPNQHAFAELYWGYAFRDFKTPENDPQDLGLHFRVVLQAF